MPPSMLHRGFFSVKLRRCSAQSTGCLIWIWKATASPHCGDWLSADCKNVCHSFAPRIQPRLVFNIRIMLLICYLAILSRSVNCTQLWRDHIADIDFKLEHFILPSTGECYVLGKESEVNFSACACASWSFSAWSFWLSVLAGSVALLWHLFQPQFILFHAPHFLFNQILECTPIKCNYFTSLWARNLLSQSWKANFKFPCRV